MAPYPILYAPTDQVEHWNHPEPAAGQPCPAGTEHLWTYGPDHKLGGLLGLANAQRLSRARLAELLGIETDDIALIHTGAGTTDGFSFTLPERYGSAMVTYGPNRLWTYCPTAHPVRSWWFMNCKCAVGLPRATVSEVLLAAAQMARMQEVKP